METTKTIRTWESLSDTYSLLFSTKRRWLFRGQKDAGWSLQPSLERALERFRRPIDQLRWCERFLLREFKRNFHRYSSYVPLDCDDAEWLALMQHHGAPTRLLDWTYSFHIALFFAIESANERSKCAIWAVDNDFLRNLLLREKATKFSKEERDIYDRGDDKDHRVLNRIFDVDADIILPMNPLRLNKRLAVQQGIFLFSQSKTEPFSTTFDRLRKGNPDAFREFKIVCSRRLLGNALRTLQNINVSRVSLFPGLDGFTQSLENRLAVPNLGSYLK